MASLKPRGEAPLMLIDFHPWWGSGWNTWRINGSFLPEGELWTAASFSWFFFASQICSKSNHIYFCSHHFTLIKLVSVNYTAAFSHAMLKWMVGKVPGKLWPPSEAHAAYILSPESAGTVSGAQGGLMLRVGAAAAADGWGICSPFTRRRMQIMKMFWKQSHPSSPLW